MNVVVTQELDEGLEVGKGVGLGGVGVHVDSALFSFGGSGEGYL